MFRREPGSVEFPAVPIAPHRPQSHSFPAFPLQIPLGITVHLPTSGHRSPLPLPTSDIDILDLQQHLVYYILPRVVPVSLSEKGRVKAPGLFQFRGTEVLHVEIGGGEHLSVGQDGLHFPGLFERGFAAVLHHNVPLFLSSQLG